MGTTLDAAYTTLGIENTASDDEVKKAYRKLAMKHHPDKNQDDQNGSSTKFDQITKAYDLIMNPKSSDEDLDGYIATLRMFNNYFGGRIQMGDNILSIPPGSHPNEDVVHTLSDGSKIRVAHEFKEQPGFTYDGLDLYTTMAIWASDVRYGKRLSVPGHPDLFPPEIVFPKETKDGDRVKLPRRGLLNRVGGRGDLFITVKFKDTTPYPNPNRVVKQEVTSEPKKLTWLDKVQRWLGWALILYVIYIYWTAK